MADRSLLNKVGEYVTDGLITDTLPRAIVRGVTVDGSEAGTLYRGTLLCAEDSDGGKLKPANGDATKADCILADDITIEEDDSESGVPAPAYFAGCFNPEKVLNKEGKPATLDAAAQALLRTKGILFKGSRHILPEKEAE